MYTVMFKTKTSGSGLPFVAFSVKNVAERSIKDLALNYGQILAVVLFGSCICGVCLGGLALVGLTSDGSAAVELALEKRAYFEKNV